jgi:hypothetical protein
MGSSVFPSKPLGAKAYGHIAHLPGSRLGPGDHRITDGQAAIVTQKLRDRHDRIIVQEKLDGSCVAVARIEGAIVPLIRAGYPAVSSHYPQHRLFHAWVMARLQQFEWLQNGERVCGEWLAQAHGTRYHLPHEPFVAFDIMRGCERASFAELSQRVSATGLIMPSLLHTGGPLSIAEAMARLNPMVHGAIDPIEGCVWRCERQGAVDFLCKYVRPDKIDGCYLPEISGNEAVWNWRPS